MITKATFQWTVTVVIDVPEKETAMNAVALLLHHAYRELDKASPVMVRCDERPDVMALASSAAKA